MIKGDKLSDPEDINQVKKLIFDHLEATDSARAKMILENWAQYEGQFIKVISKAEPVEVPPEEDASSPQAPVTSEEPEKVQA
jgi:glutamate synthase domain-containing protein 3